MDEPTNKRVDESWKQQAEREKQTGNPAAPKEPSAAASSPGPGAAESGAPEVRFDLFISGLAMEALMALGDVAHPTTRKQTTNLPQARYLIDLLGVLEQKTTGNLSADEQRLLKDALYQLRMRYLTKSGAAVST